MITRVWMLGLCVWGSGVCAKLPEHYEGLRAEQKQTLMWEQIESSEWKSLPGFIHGGWARMSNLLRLIGSLRPSFDYVSDEMPEGRRKILHPHGSVVKIRYEAFGGHPYTGIYQSGAIGLARLSLGTDPDQSGFVPGMALKFLVDGVSSKNLHVMQQLSGQGKNHNFFAEDFSNFIPEPTDASMKWLTFVFSLTHSPVNRLSVGHLAERDRFGKAINPVKAPQRLVFKPCSDVKHLIHPDSQVDFRINLMGVASGSGLYDVYASEDASDDNLLAIGKLYTTSSLVASEYGDRVLFFKHQH